MKSLKYSKLLALIITLPFCSCSRCGSQPVVVNDSASKTKVVVNAEPLKYDAVLQIDSTKTTSICKDIDLGGKIILVPKGVILESSGGIIKNGTLIGNQTKINGYKPLFENVHIKGTWIKEDISTDLFASLDYENSLCDVLALAHPEIKNKVVIEEGDYSVSAKSFQSALDVCSNTTLVIDGTIRLVPNDYKGCYVLQVKDAENVMIKGTGCIVGDKKEHKGTDGEWGHGINVLGSHKVNIQDMLVTNCWGDCIYVGDKSSNITIKNCKLNEGRRQGISVTYADRVTIKDCVITNVFGTAPQYGIDLEPNKNCDVDNILIENVKISNCHGGIMSWRPDSARIGSITLRNCKISNTYAAYPISMAKAKSFNITNCNVKSQSEYCVLVQNVDELSSSSNRLTAEGRNPIKTVNVKKKNIK